MTISYLASFAAGLISFISPCVLPLVPAYLCYLAGSSFEELSEGLSSQQIQRRVLLSSSLFVLGFTTVFVLLGASASVIGQLLRVYQDILTKISGVAILLLGLHFIGVFHLPFLNFEKRFGFPKTVGPFGAYGMGLAFAFGWTPCIGPVLATILAVAARDESLPQGMLMLTCYSLGLGLPFLAAGLALPLFMRALPHARRYINWVEKIAGLGLIGTGLLFLSGTFSYLATWLIEMFPALAKLG
jgi:cytochrome c-type biogenesis protein